MGSWFQTEEMTNIKPHSKLEPQCLHGGKDFGVYGGERRAEFPTNLSRGVLTLLVFIWNVVETMR